jgi:hypothetical protein
MIQAISSGSLAWEALEGRWKAEVMGVTSGGVFIRTGAERVLFLTYSPFHSPITINLEWGEHPVDLQENQVGSAVFLDPSRITIPGSNLAVWMRGASRWLPAAPQGGILEVDRSAAAARLKRIGLAAAQQKGDEGFGPYIRCLLDGEVPRPVGDLSEALIAALGQARLAVQQRDYRAVIEHARSWIGYGRGLTPAGDDCLAGILLVLNRWGSGLGLHEVDRGAVNQAARELARAHTTTLSCTLIHAATLGLADERILRVLDAILLGEAGEDEAIRNLVRMGHSSGVDTLTGMTLVLAARLAKTSGPA